MPCRSASSFGGGSPKTRWVADAQRGEGRDASFPVPGAWRLFVFCTGRAETLRLLHPACSPHRHPRFLRSVNGNQGDFLRSARQSKLSTTLKMSDSESPFRNEPNAFDGELSSGWDTSSEAVSLGAEGVEDTDDELFGEEVQSAPVHGVGKGLMTGQPLPLVAVYKDGTRVGPFDNQPVASTSGRSEGTAGPSRPRV
ncbi:hypothetical protein L3X38_000402, partial [Prunus dulcis]